MHLNKRYLILTCLLLSMHIFCVNSKSDQNARAKHESDELAGKSEEQVSLFEDENRDIWQKPDRVIDLLGPLEGKTVVDLGAASGYFSFRILPKAGKVIAIDIDPKYISFLEEQKKILPSEQMDKFETRLAMADDPLLAEGEADAILLVSTYVYIKDRVNYFSKLRSKLAEGGKIVIIEFKKKSIPNGPPDEEKVSLSQVESELKKSGYNNIRTDDRTLNYQYIVTARVN